MVTQYKLCSQDWLLSNEHDRPRLLKHIHMPSDQDIVNYVTNSSSVEISLLLLQKSLHRYATNITIKCDIVRRFGNVRDGGYDLCLDPPFTPLPTKCLVYSFGINYDFSFDDAVNKEFDCEVHSFDPSLKLSRVKKEHPDTATMTFHPIGLDGAKYNDSNGWKMHTLQSIKHMLGHEKKIIDILKIDIELSEWPALRDIITSGAIAAVKTLLVEIHSPRRRKNGVLTVADYFKMLRILLALEKTGFRKYLFHQRNNCCSSYELFVPSAISGGARNLCCYELFYINSHIR